jgi:FG-GAP-like repeat/FG-GAP repeat
VTPEGHAFWLRGVFNVDPSGSQDGFPGGSYAERIIGKYGSTRTWLLQTSRRLRTWGFNSVAEYSHAGFADLAPGEGIPYSTIDRVSWYGLTNQGGYAPGPFKDLIECLEGSAYTGYTAGRFPDVYDPNYTAYSNGRTAASATDPQWGPVLSSPWHIGMVMDDVDDLYGFGPGSELPSAAGVVHPHPGWVALACTPTRATSARHGVSYVNSAVYTKLALRDFLRIRYVTVAALNAAWGSTYTSWESAGAYGVGSGLLDEDGRHGWLGDTEGTLTGASAGVVADLDDFLLDLARRYFGTRVTSLKAAFPNKLVFGPATLSGWSGLSRGAILKAAGELVDVVQAGAATATVVERTRFYMGDHPIVTWEGVTANADSALWRDPQPFGQSPALTTQDIRGRRYADRLAFLLTQPTVVGLKWWALADSWAERANWGLVSLRDNAYDGREARVAHGADPWGYATGSEEHDYGDMLSWVMDAHARLPAALVFRNGVYVAVGDLNSDGSAEIVTGPGAGTGPRVRVFSGNNPPNVLADFLAYSPEFTGGVRVAVGDVNHDGVADIVTAAGPGGGPHVRVFSGGGPPTLTSLASFFAYDPGFTGGVFVAVGDVDGDGFADIVTGPDVGGGPHVRIFSGRALVGRGGPLMLAEFFAYPPSFTGGVRVAVADVDGDGFADVVTAAGPGGGPHVRVFSGRALVGLGGPLELASFFAYVPSFTGGVFVAAGDVNGDSFADVVTGADAGGGPHVRAFSGGNPPALTSLASYFAYASDFIGGVRVAVGNVDGARPSEIVTAAGRGGGAHVAGFTGSGSLTPTSFFAY